MTAQALLVASLVLALVLGYSGVAKLGDVAALRRAHEDLRVPASLSADWMVRGHPWVEIALAVGLVVLPGPWRWAAVVAALALLVAYTVLVVRAARRDDGASCGCFGADERPVDGTTVARNVVLLVVAALAALDATTTQSPLTRLVHLDAAGWAWLAAVALTAAVAVLVLRAPATTPEPDAGPPTTHSAYLDDGDDDLEDYVRVPTPDVSLRTPEGEDYPLLERTSRQAHVLLFLSPGCGSCIALIPQVALWDELMPEVTVRAVRAVPKGEDVTGTEPFDSPGTNGLWDDGAAAEAFGVQFYPTAVLLGIDGRLAGGPVSSGAGVRQFLTEVMGHLAAR